MSDSNLEQAQADGKYIRTVRSFVKREGRLTRGQAAALERSWPTMGLTHQQGLLDLTQVFGREAPTVLEIGFGMGKSLVAMAAAAPEKNFIGIEVHRPGVGACLMEAETAGLTNLRVYEHDAVEVLRDCIADGALDTVQVFFPDPWHKKRHHKRRLIQPAFVEALRPKLALGGVLHLATDWENYAEHMLEVMSGAANWRNLAEDQGYIPRPSERPLTKFEQRGERLGHGVWDLKFSRIG
ncbi:MULTISPECIES: tRNA (guanosine(46)-N7)-methyltransferase TrmB [Idiomarinaceae]|uniref:tRNA (guanine-N(7)-)-methyltransferase n=1 Tax=Pseudidiomarina fusca TaxID=2965078 RepID=A0ABU3KYQ1_9GAMM|nr:MULTISPECIES: tRNA (guanosine(46)-N7)-methyltransferase TrmB [Idiomarinaceae]MDT7526281.1 tRNA (guanosine(46)-N7)-methyltransferase TrmB [Pseudidiomarina sp. GXY010]MRJ43046.1 tRNA (guanosine(46)-N7)-methyltransferase TrmB [Idiomarina sp. FeN1]NCU58228.1 tRNA (guanosine(46)-N7)-methyltransferase TrmB [Idiomarina sp. FenA--70]NCU60926.1 tRNA (guanosine(46)-N7)-methyltransferase TrmB [Idiomarina sp. FenBw--71]UUN13999.1 tRNA (guanosine(46)-N7)-methyltransferase TrmB [Idiomarina loihiensis]